MLINEIMQWMAMAAFALALLGLYRQWGMLIGGSYGTLGATTGPRLYRALPAKALDAVRARGLAAGSGKETVLGFVTEDCSGCRSLLSTLEKSGPADLERLARHIVIVAASPSPPFAAAVEQLPVASIVDDGTIWKACNIQATPFLVTIDEKGRVLSKEVTHEIDRVARGVDVTTATPQPEPAASVRSSHDITTHPE